MANTIKKSPSTCIMGFLDFNGTQLCHRCKRNAELPIVDASECETCPHYICNKIQYPITVSAIRNTVKNRQPGLHDDDIGHLCEVRLVDAQDTYVGIFLGELLDGTSASYNLKTQELSIFSTRNPAIFVPDLGRIVWGCESWWRILPDGTLPEGISDSDIDATWYVTLMRHLMKETKN